MARTASTTTRKIESEVNTIDFVYYIAKNGGQMLTEQQIGAILFQNQSQVTAAMREAGMNYLKPVVDKVAGILPREISDESTNAPTVQQEEGKGKKANAAK
ncbi:hypothetical protein UFOVP434_80 [uncultured Caudovirales phage]|uniref:Uncharacterized protein n=1 Tax=uncultured Caudovirales phage TaxID=2100421 RepID=A0A6J5MBJ3_9CAUD|nr:hypothetical protein UFOVP434_80 [uncultured Caudovirales phage]